MGSELNTKETIVRIKVLGDIEVLDKGLKEVVML